MSDGELDETETSARLLVTHPLAHPIISVLAIIVGLGTSCMMMFSVLVTAFALLTAIRPSPWYDPRYAIPLLGMILGNCMTGIALGLNTLTTSLMLRRASVEAQLMLGATRWEAAAPLRPAYAPRPNRPLASPRDQRGTGPGPTVCRVRS